MDHGIAYELINSELKELRRKRYGELVELIDSPVHKEKLGSDGKSYQLEILGHWDSKKRDNVLIVVSADDGGLRAFSPLYNHFIMAPDGSFVGE
jgi:hypothetical protein